MLRNIPLCLYCVSQCIEYNIIQCSLVVLMPWMCIMNTNKIHLFTVYTPTIYIMFNNVKTTKPNKRYNTRHAAYGRPMLVRPCLGLGNEHTHSSQCALRAWLAGSKLCKSAFFAALDPCNKQVRPRVCRLYNLHITHAQIRVEVSSALSQSTIWRL